MQRGPILIGGLANSGKTELRLMLEAHPNLCLTRRTYMWTRFYQRFGDLALPANLERCLAQMLQNKHIRALQPDVARIRKEFAEGAPTYARLFGLFHSHYAERMGKPRWGDQLGSIERFADPIFATFADAKMIHMVRDPRHIYEEAKSRSRQRSGKVGWMVAEWLESMRLAKRNQSRYPQGYQIVRYEKLMAQPEETMQEVCRFIGEDYLPAMAHTLAPIAAHTLRAHTLPAHTFPASGMNGSALAKRPVVPHSDFAPAAASNSVSNSGPKNGRELSSRELVFLQRYAQKELLALGYFLEPAKLSLRERLLFLCLDWPANQVGMLVRQIVRGRAV